MFRLEPFSSHFPSCAFILLCNRHCFSRNGCFCDSMIDFYTSCSLFPSHVKGLLSCYCVCRLYSWPQAPVCPYCTAALLSSLQWHLRLKEPWGREAAASVPVVFPRILRLLYVCQRRRHNTLSLTLLTALTLLTSLPELALARIQLAESHMDV